ncbi:MAG: SDR family NAD(P)-dependent oxidoreductase [Acidobacteriota bacterium]
MVLRPLEDAIEAGDPIQAVLRATAVNNDGAGKVGYLAPSVDGHAAVVEEALALAQCDADTIDYVEAHGTGTKVGDPIEVSALTQAFRQSSEARQTTALGSVKTNIGHLDTAAGVAGLIKVVESLRHREIPPSLGFDSPNPLIDFGDSPFFVNAELRPWERSGHPRRAGISALGVGGTNAHAIVEEWTPAEPVAEAREWQVLLASGRTRSSAEANLRAFASHGAELSPAALADTAYTTQVARESLPYRTALVVENGDDSSLSSTEGALPTRKAPEDGRGVAFLFPGGGAQYAGMGRGLYESEPTYREALDECFALLRDQHGIDLAPLILADTDDEEADRQLQAPDFAVISIFCVEYALARHLASCGVEPAAMIGHSLGEYAAACLAGVFSLKDALRIVVLRGRLFTELPSGGMLSVQMSEKHLQQAIAEAGLSQELDIAAVNAPELTAASGTVEALERLEEHLRRNNVESRRIKIDVAAHSQSLDTVLDEFREGLASLRYHEPKIPFASNLTGAWITADEAMDPEYWLRHLRRTVRFGEGIALILDEDLTLLEVGPGNTLGTLARLAPEARAGVPAIASLRHPQDKNHDRAHFLGALAQLWSQGSSVDWQACHEHARRRVALPGYHFDQQRYWIDRIEQVAPQESPLRRRPFGEDWITTTVWDDAPPLEAQEPENRQTWLVFVDLLGLGDRVADLLEDAGHEVVRVQEGDAFHRESAKRYRLPPELGQTTYDELIARLEGDSFLPTHVLHAWSLTQGETHRRASNLFHQHQERGFDSLIRLMKALGAELGTRVEEIRVVANDLLPMGEKKPEAPGKATLLGPLQVAAQENPGLRTQCLHVATKTDDVSLLARRIANELAAPSEERVLGLVGERRLARRLEPVDLKALERTRQLAQGATVLVTGGLGDLALELAGSFAEVGANLVLLSRSAFPERSEWEAWQQTHAEDDPTARRIARIESLEADGCTVEVLRADVTDIEAVESAVRTTRDRFGAIHGVVHAAGVTDDQLILQKTSESIDRVLGPKLLGTMILAEVLSSETELEFFVAFGSTSAWLAPAGQADYTAAAQFLGSWAASHENRPKVTTLHWGAWADAGLARRTVEKLRGGVAGPLESRRLEHPIFHTLRVLPSSDPSRSTPARGGASPSVEIHGSLSSENWMLDEHRLLDGRAILPGTGHVELLLSALALHDGPSYELLDLVFLTPFWVRNDEERNVQVCIEANGDRLDLEVRSRSASGGDWALHSQASARISAESAPSPVDPERLRAGLADAASLSLGAAGDQASGFAFGPRWQVLRRARFGSDAIAEVALAPEFQDDCEHYVAHPALLDIATGFALRLAKDFDSEKEALVPLTYERLRLFERLPTSFLSRVRLATNQEDGTVRFDIWLVANDGSVLGEIQGLAFRRIAKGALFQDAPLATSQTDVTMLTPAEELFLRTVEQGITAEEGRDVLEQVLTTDAPAEVFVSPFDLETLRQQAAEAERQDDSAKFERPDLDSDYKEPETPTERALADLFEDLLGLEQVGVDDDFFALGGHSLVAVRLFARIKRQFGEEYPLSLLFEAPTVRLLAQKVRTEAIEEQESTESNEGFSYIVPLHRVEGTTKRPFFIVSGMLGNVLNLRYLARRLGDDQQVFALQARGLYGEAKPHDRFEDMATEYLEEVRRIQPEGPYFLGGFSGGGLIALEMARLLQADGEATPLLAMLDTPAKIDGPNWRDRIELQLIKWRQGGLLYPLDFLKQRLSWEQAKRRERKSHPDVERSPAIFRSAQIEQAFLTALDRYEPSYYAGTLHLFRPELDRAYKLSGRRTMNTARCFVREDNHWGELADHVDVTVVAGEHNSMVLEPHVRILANRLREALEAQPELYLEAGPDVQKKPV